LADFDEAELNELLSRDGESEDNDVDMREFENMAS